MAVNQKAIKVLNKIFEAGFTDEKEISAIQQFGDQFGQADIAHNLNPTSLTSIFCHSITGA